MSQRLEQTQETVQTQQQSLLQVAVAQIMVLPVTELATRVRDEMLENAALEEADASDLPDAPDAAANDPYGREGDEGPGDEGETPDHDGESLGDGEDSPGDKEESLVDEDENPADGADAYADERADNFQTDETADYLTQDDVPEYLRQRAEQQSEEGTFQYAAPSSFYDSLRAQMSEHDLTEADREIMEYLIGSLTDDGYLTKSAAALSDELAVYHGIDCTPADIERLTAILQRFEPRGIGAHSLQECLRLQLTDPERQTPLTPMALTVIDRYFKLFTARHWDVIRERLHTDADTFLSVIKEITRLNPRPGSALGEAPLSGAPAVVPDFYLHVTDGGDIRISLNHGEVPELRVSPSFRQSLKEYAAHKAGLSREQKEAYRYARQKVESAQQFLSMLAHRHRTLLSVMRFIADRQRDFFLNDDDESQLHPLILKEIAEKVSLDISTISRAVSGKYVQTDYGIYPLRYFFSTQFVTGDGDELSARKVQAALRRLIETEDKRRPLSDEALAARLKAEGLNVARRTVAKYRDVLGLPPARLRRDRLA